jgi:hypothetical protein
MRPALLGGALLLVACGHDGVSLRERVKAAELTDRAQDAEMQRLASRVSQLLLEYEEVDAQYRAAESAFEQARANGTLAAGAALSAEENYKSAEREYRWMTYAIIAAAAWDSATSICDGVESTRSYRQRLGLSSDVCVDHSFAHALGGINHPLNYMPLDCGENSAYGASFWGKFVDYPAYVLRGLAVSAIARLRCSSITSAWAR